MYIAEKYWDHYVGDSDDSLTLVEYLAEKRKPEIPLGEIFSDFGADKLHGNFRSPDIPLVFVNSEGWETEIHYAINLAADLAALLLECRASGSVDLRELFEGVNKTALPAVRITATPEEDTLINQVLMDFAASPLAYDLSEMAPEEDMAEMAAICGALRKELYDQRD